MEHEDAQVGRLLRELLLDPRVAAAADLAVVEVGLRRVDRDDRHAAGAQHRVALTEELLEVDVPDVARVVVPGHDDERVAVEPVEVLARDLVLVLEAERRQVARADDDVGAQLVDLADRPLEQVRLEVRPSAVEIGDVRDPEGLLRHDASLRAHMQGNLDRSAVTVTAERRRIDGGEHRPRLSLALRWCGSSRRSPTTSRHTAAPSPLGSLTRWSWSAPRSWTTTASPGSTSRTRSCSSATRQGRVTSAFTPDFYLPEQELYVEVTVMKQSLVTRKNRKLREVQRLYPDVRVKLFYRRDIERLAQRHRLRLAS